MYGKSKVKTRFYWKLSSFLLNFEIFVLVSLGMPVIHRFIFSILCHYHLTLPVYLLYFSDASWESISERVCLYHWFYFLHHQLWRFFCFGCAFKIFIFFCLLQVSYYPPSMIWMYLFSTNNFFIKLQGKEFLWIVSNVGMSNVCMSNEALSLVLQKYSYSLSGKKMRSP